MSAKKLFEIVLSAGLSLGLSLSLGACDEKKADEAQAKPAEQAQGIHVKSGDDEVNINAEKGKLQVKGADGEQVNINAGEGALKVEGAFGKINIDSKKGVLNIEAKENKDDAEEEEKEAE